MIAVLKLAGMSAVLSAGLVTAFDAPKAPEPAATGSVKVYRDRIAPEAPTPVLLAQASTGSKPVVTDASFAVPACSGQTWPYVSKDCMSDETGGVRRPVRTITIERRDEANTSTLIRVPTPTR